MSESGEHNLMHADLPPVVSVAPFDAERHAACMAYLTGVVAPNSSHRTQLYIVKALILADLFALQHDGRPIIGGPLYAWPQGPVNNNIYERLTALIEAKQADMPLPPGFHVTTRRNSQACDFAPDAPVDVDDFSPLEVSALRWAWSEIGHLTFPQITDYAHNPNKFMGAAWDEAVRGEWSANQPMDWLRLLWHFDRVRGTSHLERMREQILTSSVRVPFETPHDAPVQAWS